MYNVQPYSETGCTLYKNVYIRFQTVLYCGKKITVCFMVPHAICIPDPMVEEDEEAGASGSECSAEDSGGAESALMSRIDTIAEVLEQTSHNLALFERLLPAAKKDLRKSPRGENNEKYLTRARH